MYDNFAGIRHTLCVNKNLPSKETEEIELKEFKKLYCYSDSTYFVNELISPITIESFLDTEFQNVEFIS